MAKKKVDCSELEAAVAELALTLGTQPQFDTIDKIHAEMSKRLDGLTRTDVVNAVVAYTSGVSRELSDVQKQLADIKREARQDKEIREAITELEGHLEAGTLPEPAERKQAKVAAAVESLRKARKVLRDRLRTSEPAQKQRILASLERIEAKLAKLPELPPKKPKLDPASKELERLIFERDKKRRELNQAIRDLQPKTVWQRLAEPFNIARAVMTSGEFSGVLRQGGFIAFGHPIRAAKSLKPMFIAFSSEQKAHEIMQEIESRPNAPLYDRAKLYIAPIDSSARLGKQEEAFMSRLADKIPLVAGSQRAYSVFLNKLRADSFDVMAAGLARNGQPTMDEVLAIANFINVATGRGSLGKTLDQAAPALNTLFFAPRYVASRFQLVALNPLWHGTPKTRRMIAQEYARYLIGLGVVYALGWGGGGEIEDDPRSADFGKIKFDRTRLDPLSGLSQATVLLWRTASGQTKSSVSGQVRDIRGEGVEFGRDDTFALWSRFMRSKLSPLMSFGVDMATGENVVGQPVTLTSEASELMFPITWREVYESMQQQGVPKGTAMGILAFFGVGLQTYEDRPKKDKEKNPGRVTVGNN